MPKTTILWDNDGVLVDTEILYYRANRQVLAGLGVELTVDLFREFYLKDTIGGWHLARGLSPEAVEEMRVVRNGVYAELLRTEARAMPGAAEVLDALSGRLGMGVVTSSRRDHFDLIHARTGFGRYFDVVVSCDDVSRTKPDPEPYLRALALTGRRPAECVAIEDSERGLIAATAAGLECWVIPTDLSRGGDFRLADRVLSGLSDVAALLGDSSAAASAVLNGKFGG
jgi:HAD superfamily hydrolase (TIGR01509 family)